MTVSILLADDYEDAAESLQMLLQAQGFEVSVAYDGGAAYAEFQINRHPVVVLDLRMPFLSGFEVAARIRSDPANSDVLLIAVTGATQPEDIERASRAGFDAHLTKPVEFDELLQVLSEWGVHPTQAEHPAQ